MLQKPKGTYDIYGDYALKYNYIKKVFECLCESYNFNYIETPSFEKSELYHRGVGETSDIVTKETYDFKDRSDRNMTLRPEGTAGVARSIIENKLYVNLPLKLWYEGSMFRYERPQSGRFREFRQFGVEAYGSNNPLLDAEVITMMVTFYEQIGLKGIKVKINSLGDNESRKNYKNALINHFKNNINELCDDCKVRFEKNPLRLLDCKIDKDNEIMINAPKMSDYLTDDSKEHFENVKKYLKLMNIDFIEDSSLVRGLDYYTNTVFEIEADIKDFGSQNVMGGGGRYNNLLESLDGPSIPAVGFAIGVERVINAIEVEGIKFNIASGVDAYILNISENEVDYAINLAKDLRDNDFKVDMDLQKKNMKAKFKESDRYNSKYIIIIGEDEVNSNILTIRDNLTKEETKVERDNLIDFLSVNI